MEEVKFYRCRHCGNVIVHLVSSGVNVVCCGEPMQLLVPNTQDASQEKHVPVIEKTGNILTVRVGSVEHPSLPEHFIEWIAVQTPAGLQIHYLKPGDKPEARFALADDATEVTVYEFCNLHGLWKSTL